MMITDWILVIFTAVIAFFTYLVWKVYERIAWLTGAMETHSDLMLRIEASRGINGRPIRLVWWDPTIVEPPINREHGQEVNLETIYCYLPPKLRKNKPSWKARMKELIRFP
jgi:hypothetical protein